MFETKVRTDGSGVPLLFLHGAGGLRGWDTFLVELAKNFTVYAPAHPGFETSTGIEHIDDMLDMVVYYNDLLDALHLESVHVIGHSMGGMIGAELAGLRPRRVRKVVLGNAGGVWVDGQRGGGVWGMAAERLAVALWH